jgi:hypothetical protein
MLNTPRQLRNLFYKAFKDMDTSELFHQEAIDKVVDSVLKLHSLHAAISHFDEKFSILSQATPDLKSLMQQLPPESKIYLLVQIAKSEQLETFINILDLFESVSIFLNPNICK